MTDSLEVNGIVLSSMPVGEADRRLSILTKELGRISCFARGSRKPTSPLVSATRPFVTGKFYIYSGKDAYALNRAVVSEHFEDIVQDVVKTAYGSYFLELITRFSREEYDGGKALTLLYYALRALTNPHIPPELSMRIFELRVLVNEGVAPEFTENGDFTKKFGLSKSAAYALNYVETAEIGKLFTFNVTDSVLAEMGKVTDYLITANVDRPLKSREFIDVFTQMK